MCGVEKRAGDFCPAEAKLGFRACDLCAVAQQTAKEGANGLSKGAPEGQKWIQIGENHWFLLSCLPQAAQRRSWSPKSTPKAAQRRYWSPKWT